MRTNGETITIGIVMNETTLRIMTDEEMKEGFRNREHTRTRTEEDTEFFVEMSIESRTGYKSVRTTTEATEDRRYKPDEFRYPVGKCRKRGNER